MAKVYREPLKTLRVPRRTLDRLDFMKKLTGIDETDEVVLRALQFYDRALCAAVAEGAAITIKHRDGSLEDFAP